MEETFKAKSNKPALSEDRRAAALRENLRKRKLQPESNFKKNTPKDQKQCP